MTVMRAITVEEHRKVVCRHGATCRGKSGAAHGPLGHPAMVTEET